MKSNRIIWFIVVVMVAATIVTRMGTLRGSGQQSSTQINRTESTPPQQKQSDADFMSQFPVADYDPAEEYDTEKKAKRELKNKRYDNRLRLVTDELPFEDLGQVIAIKDDFALIPALPAGESEIVIVGEVLDAHAYVSNNKKGVYSEFTVRVGEVLKNSSTNITQGSSICVDREGGFVRYKNGKMRLHRIMGQGMPRVGRRYVLFLKNPEKSPNYDIIRAYELKAVGIANLESSNQFKDYKDMKEAAFLEEVRKAVAQSLRPLQKEKFSRLEKFIPLRKIDD